MGHRWTPAEAKLAGKKGLLARLKVAPEQQPVYRRGYSAGWVACERFYRQRREEKLACLILCGA